MKSFVALAIVFGSVWLAACGNAAAPVQTNSNSVTIQNANDHTQTMIAHSTENQPPPSVDGGPTGAKTKWSQSGNPIDTAKLNDAVSNAENAAKSKPTDAAKKSLADAYFKRAFALTEARQYASTSRGDADTV